MRVLVSGASGLVGSALCAALAARGDAVLRLVRRAPRTDDERAWDPALGTLAPAALDGVDAVVHLAGAGIAERRWTSARKRELVESRTRSTALLATRIAAASPRPRVFVSASAVGWYGDRGDELLREDAPDGTGFLAALAREWEAAAVPAAAAGVRVAHPRIGLVLSAKGGALARVLPPARFGLGGPLGSGRQWWSWITLDDLVATLLFVLEHDSVRGPFNAAAPAPVTNADFARTLGRVLQRPAFLPAPAFALRLALGRELADEVLLASQRVQPAALLAADFAFRDAELAPALARLLGTRSAA